jgi:hypothetical protein
MVTRKTAADRAWQAAAQRDKASRVAVDRRIKAERKAAEAARRKAKR